MLDIFIASGAGAAAVVLIDLMVKYYLYKKRNFREAISIQLALHQMLVVSLQIRKLYDDRRAYFLTFYSQAQMAEPEKIWHNFRHIDFSPFMNTFDVIKSDWDFTQFLTGRENSTRDILKYLIPAKLGYQSLMSIIKERNDLLWYAQQKIEQIRSKEGLDKNFEYINNNLQSAIGLPINERLRGITDEYIDRVTYEIVDCNKAFNALSKYINDNFCHYLPLTLNIPDDMRKLFSEIIEADNQKPKK